MSRFHPSRRFVLTGAAAAATVLTLPRLSRAAGGAPLSVAMLIPGRIDDGGFMQAGYAGLTSIRDQLGATIAYTDAVKPEPDLLAAALRDLAAAGPDMVIAHGGQNSKAAEMVAPEFPAVQFVVVQGGVTGPDLSSYEVLQEESAWLGGALAGLTTKSGVVGHISGIRVRPGLKGRAAFAAGLRHTNPDARLLTNFCGAQDDVALAKKVAQAEIAEGADVIFTMLNAGRTGAIEACRETGCRQIGNVVDWTATDPQVFIASAIADVSKAGLQAARDFRDGRFQPGRTVHIGIADPQAVRLALAPDVPQAIRATLDSLATAIAAGEITVSTDYDGPEFTL